MAQLERRRHPRLPIRVPIDLAAADGTAIAAMAVTTDVASGGLRFQTDHAAPVAGDEITFTLTIPPGDGHWPYPCTLRGRGCVLRAAATPGRAGAVAVGFDGTPVLDVG